MGSSLLSSETLSCDHTILILTMVRSLSCFLSAAWIILKTSSVISPCLRYLVTVKDQDALAYRNMDMMWERILFPLIAEIYKLASALLDAYSVP